MATYSSGMADEFGTWGPLSIGENFALPQVSGGELRSGMDFNKISNDSAVWASVPGPGPSPLQQWFSVAGNPMPAPGFAVGMPVKICHLLSPDSQRYNGLVGDIHQVHTVPNAGGTLDMLFDVRIPILPADLRSVNLAPDDPHFKALVSASAEANVNKNRSRIAPMYGVSATYHNEEENAFLPPYVMLSRLPSEKIEPLAAAAAASIASSRLGRAGCAQTSVGLHAPPPIVLEPKWGEPMPMIFGDDLPARAFIQSDEALYASIEGQMTVPRATAVSSGILNQHGQTSTDQVAYLPASIPTSATGPMVPVAAPIYEVVAATYPPEVPRGTLRLPPTDGPPTPPLTTAVTTTAPVIVTSTSHLSAEMSTGQGTAIRMPSVPMATIPGYSRQASGPVQCLTTADSNGDHAPGVRAGGPFRSVLITQPLQADNLQSSRIRPLGSARISQAFTIPEAEKPRVPLVRISSTATDTSSYYAGPASPANAIPPQAHASSWANWG